MNRLLIAVAALALFTHCNDDPPGGSADGSATSDGAAVADGSTTTDGATIGGDGAVASDGSTSGDGSTPGDGGAGDTDPLMQPRSEFCEGEGSVVIVGADNDCAGEIAEEAFQYAVCTCESLTVGSLLRIDSFDSDLGAYGTSTPNGPNVFEDGHLGVNAGLNTDGKVEVFGSAFVQSGGFAVGAQSLVSKSLFSIGDAVQDRSSCTIEDDATVSGDIVGRFNIGGDLTTSATSSVDRSTSVAGQVVRRFIPPADICPCGNSQILDVAALVAFGSQTNDNATLAGFDADMWSAGAGPATLRLPCGRYYLTGVEHPGSLTLIAEGRTVLFVDGNFAIGGGLDLSLEGDGEIDLFVTGSLSVGAAARLGSAEFPSKVRTYVGGDGTIDLTASSVFGGNLYAPRADVVFGAGAELFGAVFAKNLATSGSTRVHFDRAVRSAGDDCEEPPVMTDAGTADATPDAGNENDGGPNPDATTPDTGDTGPTGCNNCGECSAPSGCVIPEGQTTGMCGACTSNLDCCPPNTCINGACIIDF